MKIKNNNNGFTIVELLVTISIIAMLSTIGFTGYQAVSKGGRDALRKTDLEQLRSAFEIYKSETGAYPQASETCLADISTDFINPYPDDPKSPSYKYCYIRRTNLSYELCAHLENGDSNDYCDGGSACQSNCNYRVLNP